MATYHQYQPPHQILMTSTYHGPPALHIGPPRHPNTGDYRPEQIHQSGKASVDPITLGFDKLNARLDSMDRRVDKLESRMNANDRRLGKLRPPQRPDPEPPYDLPNRGGADWDKQHRRYTQPTYRRPQHHQSDRYPPPPPYQPDRRRHQTRYQLPEHYQPFDYGLQPTYRGLPRRQFLQLQHEPSRQSRCWDPPSARVPMGNLDYEESASIYYPDYDCDSDGYDEDADVHHDPSSNSQLTVIVVPPPPPQRSSSCLNMTSHFRSAASLPTVADVPSSNLPPTVPSCSPDDDSGKESGLLNELPPLAMISPPCSPYIRGEEETLLDDDEEVDSIKEVKKVVASLDAAGMTSHDVVENCFSENGGDARLIPPRNDTSCLSILGSVDKLFVLAWNFSDHIGSPLLIFDGGDKWRYSVVRYVFDPGGDASPKLLLSTLVVALWFPP